MYQGVYKILPGIIEVINLDKEKLSSKKIHNNTVKNYLTNNTNLSLDEILYKSIETRLEADVKVATLISGGVDSTLIASIAHKINKNNLLITADLGKGNDLHYSEMLAKNLGTNLEIIKLNYHHNIIDRIESMTKIFEIPLSLYGMVVGMNIFYEKISKLGIRVCISGNGGDEIYGGYFNRHAAFS